MAAAQPPRDPRILVCSESTPWASASGYQLRLAMVAEALSRFGLVDLCILDGDPSFDEPWPAWVGDAERYQVERRRWWLAKAFTERTAPVLQARLAGAAEPGARTRFFSRSYDLTWCVEVAGYEPVAALVSAPLVLELDDVYSALVAHKRRALLSSWWQPRAWQEALAEPAYFPGAERRWRHWEREVVGRCSRVVACSDLDRARLADRTVVTIPNCYPRPAHPAGARSSADAPLRVGFVGTLDWQPNRDGLRWFATRVWPRIRALEPDAEFDVLGEDRNRPPAVERQPGVRMLGFVPDIAAHLSEVSVLVAPVRFGGGTRIKILEAFAQRIPMVSTVVGAEGLEARDGEHLLVRDRPAEFARAVVDAHRNRPLRDRLVDAGARLYEAQHTWERGLDAVTSLARELLQPALAR